MAAMKPLLLGAGLAAVAICLGACERKSTRDAEPTPTAEPSPAAPEAESPPVVGRDVESPTVEAPATVDLDPQTLENQRVKEEVLKRIDVMPDLAPETKDKLYVQVERARAMGKLMTIPFPSGSRAMGSGELASLGEKLNLPQVRQLTGDPTVIFVVLGFADKKGDPKQNQEISLARANSVLRALQTRFGLMNIMHAVGMGSSEMFDAVNMDKNRVVEVWAVLP